MNKEITVNAEFYKNGTWYKENHFWRRENSDGSDGMGDLVYNTCGKILWDKDKSEWAHESLKRCYDILRVYKRWPDFMNDHKSVVDTRLESEFNRILNKIRAWGARKDIKLIGKILMNQKPFRYQRRTTRDMYVAFYTACMFLEEYSMIGLISPRFKINRFDLITWRMYLITRKVAWRTLYRFFDGIGNSKKEFVLALKELKEYAMKMRVNKKLK